MCRVFYDVKYAFPLLCTMEKVNFGYSLKNIPLPSQDNYEKRMIFMTEELVQKMRWKALFFLNPELKSKTFNTFGFRTEKSAPQIIEMMDL